MKRLFIFIFRILAGSQKLIPIIDSCISAVERAKGKVLDVRDLPEADNERLKATFPLVLSLTRMNDDNFLATLGKLEKSLSYLRTAIILFRGVSGLDETKISDTKIISLVQARYVELKKKS